MLTLNCTDYKIVKSFNLSVTTSACFFRLTQAVCPPSAWKVNQSLMRKYLPPHNLIMIGLHRRPGCTFKQPLMVKIGGGLLARTIFINGYRWTLEVKQL